MTAILSAVFLVAGSALCLVAAVGVLRLPDFFMRMHAATKAGVAGCGLLLIGVAFGEPSVSMWIKVSIAIAFLLLTTPIAGHLLGRAGYFGGVPLWQNTVEDQLKGVLPRGDFESPTKAASSHESIRHVVLAIASGDGMEEAMAKALELAQQHGTGITAFAIIDTKTLHDVGPVPLGGIYHARQLRNTLISQARTRVAATVETFERLALQAGVSFDLKVEEGDPAAHLQTTMTKGHVLVFPSRAWFDHGLSAGSIDPIHALKRSGLPMPIAGNGDNEPIIHYGNQRAER